jgi:hypothetical protein
VVFGGRYVREWLGCMVAGEVIQAVRGRPERYYIAEDHKGFLDKIGIGARLFASYAVRYNAVKTCFKADGPAGELYVRLAYWPVELGSSQLSLVRAIK